jgi:anti-sigma regulatory factor (Ser/Thr protein kinase)
MVPSYDFSHYVCLDTSKGGNCVKMCWRRDLTRARECSELRRQVMAYLRLHGSDDDDYGAAELVLGELLSNVVRYTPGHVCIEVGWSDHHAQLTVHDAGRGFDWTPTLPVDPESESGRGSYIVTALTLAVDVYSDTNGSRITVMVPIAKPARPPVIDACPFSRTFATPGVCDRPRVEVARALAL